MAHPLRGVSISVYGKVDGNGGPGFIAKYVPFSDYPIFFYGETAEEARERARAWADEKADQNEASYEARKSALEKARRAKQERAKRKKAG